MGKIKIDISLRDIISSMPSKFIQILTNKKGKELLDSNLPEVKDKRADLIVLLEDDSIFHLELQSYNDNNIAFRMLEYYLLIKQKYKNDKIIQICLYVGDKPMNMNNKIDLNNLKYSFTLKDIKELDCNELLDSNIIEDKILSVLCNIKDEDRFLNSIIQELLKLPENKRKDYIKKLLSFSRYRPKINDKLTSKLEEEVMPLTIELENDPYYKQGVMQSKIEDAIVMIKKFNISPEDVAKELKISLKLLLDKIKSGK